MNNIMLSLNINSRCIHYMFGNIAYKSVFTNIARMVGPLYEQTNVTNF
jgi:hypothetical protein